MTSNMDGSRLMGRAMLKYASLTICGHHDVIGESSKYAEGWETMHAAQLSNCTCCCAVCAAADGAVGDEYVVGWSAETSRLVPLAGAPPAAKQPQLFCRTPLASQSSSVRPRPVFQTIDGDRQLQGAPALPDGSLFRALTGISVLPDLWNAAGSAC